MRSRVALCMAIMPALAACGPPTVSISIPPFVREQPLIDELSPWEQGMAAVTSTHGAFYAGIEDEAFCDQGNRDHRRNDPRVGAEVRVLPESAYLGGIALLPDGALLVLVPDLGLYRVDGRRFTLVVGGDFAPRYEGDGFIQNYHPSLLTRVRDDRILAATNGLGVIELILHPRSPSLRQLRFP